MLVILGYLVIIGSILGGYLMVGGSLGALYQPSELLIIGGSALGAFIVGNNAKAIKGTVRTFPQLFKGSKYSRDLYMDLMALLFRLMAKSRQQRMLSLEGDIDSPCESEIFSSYPRVIADSHVIEFITDYMRLMISGNMNAFEIETLMDEEIETLEHELEVPAMSLNLMGDGLPAFAIFAAVMGVVHSLAYVDRPDAELGMMIAHAMVGTFLGILLAYGVVSPLASLLRQKNLEKVKVLQCIKVTLLSSLNGYAPQIAVEFERKTLYSTVRPTFTEMEEHIRRVKAPAQQAAESD